MARRNAEDRTVAEVLSLLAKRLKAERKKKGDGVFASRHEISGVVREEYREFDDEVQRGHLDDIERELLDLAVAALWGVVSIKEGMDW
jgi:hypothetical protein